MRYERELEWYKNRKGDTKLRRELMRDCDRRHNFYVNRVANLWNGVPENVKEAENSVKFKESYDEWMKGVRERNKMKKEGIVCNLRSSRIARRQTSHAKRTGTIATAR